MANFRASATVNAVAEALSLSAPFDDAFLAPLREVAGIRAGFIGRIPGVGVDGEREEVLARLEPEHRRAVEREFGGGNGWRAEQVHGAGVAVVPAGGSSAEATSTIPGVDALATAGRGELLGVYVADCGPVWLVDRGSGAIALVHSGRKGTELGILGATVARMGEAFGSRPAELVGVLGPCIRPPHYEVDFAADLRRQAVEAGIGAFHDCGIDTAADPERWYSYRMERGRTGRMLALLMRE